MNLGVLLLSLTILGYASHYLNQKFLSSSLLKPLYYLGTTIHELSHAIACIAAGAPIHSIKIFSPEPQVTHGKPFLPWMTQPLISLAPVVCGLLFLFAINHWLLKDYLILSTPTDLTETGTILKNLLLSLHLADFRTYIWLFLTLNVGAMLGPSWQDLKNIWPFLIIAWFITWPPLLSLGLLVNTLLIANILIQGIIIAVFGIIKR